MQIIEGKNSLFHELKPEDCCRVYCLYMLLWHKESYRIIDNTY